MPRPGRCAPARTVEGKPNRPARRPKAGDARHADGWPDGGGALGGLIRAHDWALTPLGPIKAWPQSLKTAVDLLLRSPLPIVLLWGPDGVMLYNDAYSGFAGSRHPRLLGSKVREGWPEVASFNDNVMRVGLAGGTLSYKNQELTLYRNDRPEQVWMNLDYSPVLDESGRPGGVIAFVVETTERVLAERESKAEGERLATMFRQAPGFMGLLRGPEHVYELANDALVALGGGRPLLGLPFRKAWPELEGQGFYETLDRVYSSGEAFTARRAPFRLILGPSGTTEERFLDLITQPVCDAAGVVTGIFIEGYDVTEQARAEVALRESEARFRSMTDAVPAIVWITDANGRVEFFNKQWSEYTGAPYQPETAAEVAADFLHPDDAAATMERFEEATRTCGTFRVEHRIRSKDGVYRWFLVRGEPERDPRRGTIVRWFGTSVDIHDRKCAEAALQAAHDGAEQARRSAEDANQAKSRFLAAASHDLRQPMQSLLLFLDVLKPHVTSKGEEALNHLGRGLDALRDLLDSLLDVSRLDAGVVQPTIETFPIQDLVEQIGAAYTPVAAARGIAFRVTACPATVCSDRTLLGRMVRNLVENALRYTERGSIVVECSTVGDHLSIAVADTGIGIPREHLARIWEEFHQVGNPERDRNRGLGLGLSIVQRLSVLLGHPVEVRSSPGRGSVFSLDVPLGREEQREEPQHRPAPPAPPVRAAAGDGRFAVLVEDDAIVLLALKATFEGWGYTVLAAGSTEQALVALEKAGRRPDIIVADYRLREGRTGTEAMLRVRDLYGADIPGIIVTGETGPDAQRDATAHALGIIHKPVTPRQLGQVLESHLNRQARADEGRHA